MHDTINCGWQSVPKASRSAFWAIVGAAIGSFGLGFTGVAFLGPSLGEQAAAMAFAAMFGPGAALGVVWGYCLARMFGRLKCLAESDGECRRQCLAGIIVRVHKNDDWYRSWVWDPDLTFDVVPIERDLAFVTDFADYIRCHGELTTSAGSSRGAPVIHCEIVSAIQNAACIGSMVGALAGAFAGAAAVVALAPAALACGPFVLLCLLAILILGAAITAASSWVGGLVGAGIGAAIDSSDELLESGEIMTPGDHVSVRGEWINDLDHGWNELHPVTDFWLLARNSDNTLMFPEHASLASFEALHAALDQVITEDDCPGPIIL